MKRVEPEIGQLVYVFNKDIFVRIIDIECINSINLYYTDDNSCYVEEQLHYIPKHKQESDEINQILTSVIEEWLTPDKALKINVNIFKKIGNRFGVIKRQD